MKENIILIWKYIVVPIVETALVLFVLWFFISITRDGSWWFGIPALAAFLGLCANAALVRMYKDEEKNGKKVNIHNV